MHRPTSPFRPRGRRTRGQSLVEFALILPVMLILLATAIDLGRILYSQIVVTNAAKEGALVASQGGTYLNNQACSDTNTVMCSVLTEASGGFVQVDKARVSLTPAVCQKNAMHPATGTPPIVTVSVQAPFRVLTPIIGNIIGSNLLLTGEADATCMTVPRVTYPQPPAPVATFTVTPNGGPLVSGSLTVNVNASTSYSTGATITGYTWDFGASGVTASKTYSAAGTYTITLTVTNSLGGTATASRTFTVTGSGGPTCPAVAFNATSQANPGNPHRMDLAAVFTPTSTVTSGWSWTWSGAISSTSGPNVNNINFPTSGQQSVTVTATKGPCTVTATQIVNAP